MTANVVRVNSDYKIQCVGGGKIILDTGNSSSGTYGEVFIQGDLKVLGETTVLQTNVVNVSDLILTLNDGETGAGVTGSISEPRRSGIQIDRGTLSYARWIWDETQTWVDPASNTLKSGLWVSKTITGGLNGIQTNSITTGSTGDNLYLLNQGTSVISVTGTTNYEQQVLDYSNGMIYKDKDIIPNIKAVVDKIKFDLSNIDIGSITRANSSLAIFDSDIKALMVSYSTAGTSNYVTINHFPVANKSIDIDTNKYVVITGNSSPAMNGTFQVISAYPQDTFFVIQVGSNVNYPNYNWSGTLDILNYNSNGRIILDGNNAMTVNPTGAVFSNFSISSNTLSTITSGSDLILQAAGTGHVQVNDVLRLNYQPAPTAVSNTVQVYAASNGVGRSGLYFVNTDYSDELISKKKAIAFSILM